MIVFGPVPSRRLGQSLGINNITPKTCSYSCIYCQIGKTTCMEISRRNFYNLEEIVSEVENSLEILKNKNERIDYITFVPDGEPTLDINLGKEICELKKFGIKIAVITNSSLIWDEDVRKDLSFADLVSLKIDCLNEGIWKRINRPHKKLDLEKILKGIEIFSHIFKGTLFTETMVISGVNDDEEEMEKIAEFLEGIKPDISYLSIPTRPPAEIWVKPPDEEKLNNLYQIFKNHSINIQLLTTHGGTSFGFKGDIERDFLDIVSVHPMRRDQVDEFLKKSGGRWEDIDKLIKEEKVVEVVYQGEKYYLKRLKNGKGRSN
ncbi:MAG TPA: radical SAM protein [Firmicutes bacterium]|nr:radical SAM protein [Bacillota bacterium]